MQQKWLIVLQGFGQFTGALVMLIVTAGFKESLETASTYAKCTGVCSLAVDKMWRVLIGISTLTLHLGLTIYADFLL